MTTAKEVQVSADGIDWFTLPGSSGEWNDDAEQIDDTIFGQTYTSTQPGLITWTANAQAFYKGFAGYVASIKSSGTPTAMSEEPMVQVGSSQTYAIADDTKNVWDYNEPLVVSDSGGVIDEVEIESINWLFGRITFVDGFSPSGAVEVEGTFLPMSEVARANAFTLTQTAETIDRTDFATARGNNGYRVFDPGLRTVSLELGGFYDADGAVWEILEAREDMIIEINPDGSGLSLARGVFKLVSRNQSGDVGALEEETRTFNLSVPENVDTIFDWIHDENTTLSQAIRILLDSYTQQAKPFVRYAPEGADELYFTGSVVLTDVSLSSGLDAMNEFQASMQGDGGPQRIGSSS